MLFFLQLFLIPTDIDPGIKEQLLLDIQGAVHSVEGLEELEIGISLLPDQIPYELGAEIIANGEFRGISPNPDQLDGVGTGINRLLRKLAYDHINDPERLSKPEMARCNSLDIKITVLGKPENYWYGHEVIRK